MILIISFSYQKKYIVIMEFRAIECGMENLFTKMEGFMILPEGSEWSEGSSYTSPDIITNYYSNGFKFVKYLASLPLSKKNRYAKILAIGTIKEYDPYSKKEQCFFVTNKIKILAEINYCEMSLNAQKYTHDPEFCIITFPNTHIGRMVDGNCYEYIEKYDGDINIKDSCQTTALQTAIFGVNHPLAKLPKHTIDVKTVKLLLNKNADTSDLFSGWTVLIKALIDKNDELTELLVEKADIHQYGFLDENKDEFYPLTVAVSNNYIFGVKLLLEKGADPMRETEGYNSPFHLAIYDEKIDILKLLMNYKVNVGSCNGNGIQSINISKNPKIVEILTQS